MKKRVLLLGNGIVGNLCALYLQRRLGDSAEIVVIGPESRGGLPVVGESTIEITTELLEEDLGLGDYLCANHNPKFGLTYYFQLDPSKPEERTYSVHANNAAPRDVKELPAWDFPWARPPSWLLNREVFDRDMRQRVTDSGIERIYGMARDVTLDGDSGHVVKVEETEGGERTVRGDWLIDATGRNRFLARRQKLTVKSKGQRNCFWFRLEGFDRSHLSQLTALGPGPDGPEGPYHYERYFTTHHFFGRGNWIWLIPLRTQDGSERISIGFTSHPDHFQGDVRSIEGFLEQVRGEHPAIADLVESGSNVIETNLLRNYHYTAERVYSPDRWCMLGDAAYALDPLFSNGLAFSSLQMRQIGAMIARDIEGDHDPEYVDSLSRAVLAPLDSSQDAISDWYSTMHDAYLANLRLYWIEISYFYLLLPSVINRCYYQPDRLALWHRVFGHRKDRDDRFDLPKALVESRKRFDMPKPEHFIYMGKRKVNPRALEDCADLLTLQEQFVDGARLRTELMRTTLERVGMEPEPSAA